MAGRQRIGCEALLRECQGAHDGLPGRLATVQLPAPYRRFDGADLNGARLARACRWQQLRLGFLRTYSSGAAAVLRCAPPCRCAETRLEAHTDARTSTTQFESVAGGARAPDGESCKLELELVTAGEPFKLVSMHVS